MPFCSWNQLTLSCFCFRMANTRWHYIITNMSSSHFTHVYGQGEGFSFVSSSWKCCFWLANSNLFITALHIIAYCQLQRTLRSVLYRLKESQTMIIIFHINCITNKCFGDETVIYRNTKLTFRSSNRSKLSSFSCMSKLWVRSWQSSICSSDSLHSLWWNQSVCCRWRPPLAGRSSSLDSVHGRRRGPAPELKRRSVITLSEWLPTKPTLTSTSILCNSYYLTTII